MFSLLIYILAALILLTSASEWEQIREDGIAQYDWLQLGLGDRQELPISNEIMRFDDDDDTTTFAVSSSGDPMSTSMPHHEEHKVPRTHIKGQEYDEDIQQVISSLVKDHGVSRNVAYRYVDQGIKYGTIFDLEEFKQQCIDRSKRNKAKWGKGSAARAFRDGSVYQLAKESITESKQSDSQLNDVAEQLIAMSESNTTENNNGNGARILYRIKSSTGNFKRWTKQGHELIQELEKYGMSRHTAKRYLEKGLESGEIYNLEKFKEDCRRKYVESGMNLGRYAKAKGSN